GRSRRRGAERLVSRPAAAKGPLRGPDQTFPAQSQSRRRQPRTGAARRYPDVESLQHAADRRGWPRPAGRQPPRVSARRALRAAEGRLANVAGNGQPDGGRRRPVRCRRSVPRRRRLVVPGAVPVPARSHREWQLLMVDQINSISENGDGASEQDRKWYVIHTYSGYENKVKTNLEHRIESMGVQDKIFQVVIPTEEE